MRPWPILALISSLLVACTSAQQLAEAPSASPSPEATPTASPVPTIQYFTPASPTPTPPASPVPSFDTFGDGTWTVGKDADITPGTYRTEGNPGCYWARLKSFSGSLGSILANDTTDDPAVVTIKSTDKGFESDNCGEWTTDLSQITSSKTEFGNGVFIVHTDITPGTYKSDGGEGCYWARLKDFLFGLGSILANGLPSGHAIVTIKSTDKGFQSSGCADWTRA